MLENNIKIAGIFMDMFFQFLCNRQLNLTQIDIKLSGDSVVRIFFK